MVILILVSYLRIRIFSKIRYKIDTLELSHPKLIVKDFCYLKRDITLAILFQHQHHVT